MNQEIDSKNRYKSETKLEDFKKKTDALERFVELQQSISSDISESLAFGATDLMNAIKL